MAFIDIGLSLHQIEASGRGSKFSRDEPLDMRMDVRSDVTAADLVASMTERELAQTFSRYGEERWAARIARHLVAKRKTQSVATSGQLARLVSEAVPAAAARKQKIHPATRVFMALRIAVNRELEVLDRFLETAVDLLNPGRPPVCARLPFPGRPDCQTPVPGHGAPVHLSAKVTPVCVRTSAKGAVADTQVFSAPPMRRSGKIPWHAARG